MVYSFDISPVSILLPFRQNSRVLLLIQRTTAQFGMIGPERNGSRGSEAVVEVPSSINRQQFYMRTMCVDSKYRSLVWRVQNKHRTHSNSKSMGNAKHSRDDALHVWYVVCVLFVRFTIHHPMGKCVRINGIENYTNTHGTRALERYLTNKPNALVLRCVRDVSVWKHTIRFWVLYSNGE